jgi:hypothetical protein
MIFPPRFWPYLAKYLDNTLVDRIITCMCEAGAQDVVNLSTNLMIKVAFTAKTQ